METATTKQQETLSEILGSAWESYSWWHGVDYAQGCDWNICPQDLDARYITVYHEDMEDETVTRATRLTARKILEVFHRFDWLTDDMDAVKGDYIMQTAVFGEEVYC